MEWLCLFIHHTIWDEQEPFSHIDMIDCILTGFVKMMHVMLLSLWNYVAGMCQNYHKSSIVLNIPKTSLLKSRYWKKYMKYRNTKTKKIYIYKKNTRNTKIFLPKKIPKSKISHPKKSFDHLGHLISGVPAPGIISTVLFFFLVKGWILKLYKFNFVLQLYRSAKIVVGVFQIFLFSIVNRIIIFMWALFSFGWL